MSSISSRPSASNNDQTLGVDLDSAQLNTYVPPSSSGWTSYSVTFTIATTGSHTISFQGLNGAGDNTAFVDNVQLYLESPPTVVTPAAANPDPASGTAAILSVLGEDAGGESSLTYTWAVTGNVAGHGDLQAQTARTRPRTRRPPSQQSAPIRCKQRSRTRPV